MDFSDHPKLPDYRGIRKPKCPPKNSPLEAFEKYLEAIQKWDIDHELYLDRVKGVLEGYPPEKMKLPCLKMYCEVKGVPTSGQRAQLLKRLELLKTIEPVKPLVRQTRKKSLQSLPEFPNRLDPSQGNFSEVFLLYGFSLSSRKVFVESLIFWFK